MPLDVPPPRGSRFGSPLRLSRVHWVRPELVAEVKFLTCTDDNLLRQVVYEGRPGKSPELGCVLEGSDGPGTEAGNNRYPRYNFLVLAEWMAPADTDRCVAWARQTYAEMEPFFGSGRYVNYLGDDETGEPVVAAYGPNYRRLQQVKTKYDPTNLLHMNQNIRPLS